MTKITTEYIGVQGNTQTSWWAAAKDEVHSALFSMIDRIDKNQSYRRAQNLRFARLYQNLDQMGLGIDARIQSPVGTPFNARISYNLIKSCVDTLTAKIARHSPRARILTEKGDYQQQTRAKNLTKYLDGVFHEQETYIQGQHAFRDGGIFGTGCIKVYIDWTSGKVCTERVLVDEIVVDDAEGSFGRPRNMYQRRLISKEVLMGMYPDKAAQIQDLASEIQPHNGVGEMVKVVEGWRLPDINGEGGRHTLCVQNITLTDDEWEYDFFPFAFYRYNHGITGFYGRGIAEELLGTQLEINKLLRNIQLAQHLIAVPRIMVDARSQVSTAHLNNEIGAIIKHTGDAPRFLTPTAMSGEIYNHVKWLIQSGYEKVGISQLSATSKKPSGLDSRVALREYQDIETERFSIVGADYNTFFQEIAKKVICFSRDLYTDHPELKVKADGHKFLEQINWSDVDMEDDKFIMKMYSSSLFPTTPAGKIAKAEEYIQAGWMDRDTALRILDFPDLEAWENLETADKNYVDDIITGILDKGQYKAPEPEMILDQDINIMRKAYIDALQRGVTEDKLELILRWIDAATELMPTPAQPETGTQLAQAEALPTSPLIPQG